MSRVYVAMPKHKITEASQLVNKNRKTLQRYMSSGKISYETALDGNRVIDTSELIRVFGVTEKIKKMTENVAPVANSMSHDVAAIMRELKEIRKENKELKKSNIKLNEKLDEALNLMIPFYEDNPQLKKEDEPQDKKVKNKYDNDIFDIPSFHNR